MALRCGRRFGKTELAKAWITQGLIQGEACAWFAPQHMLASEVYADLSRHLAPLLTASSRGRAVMRLVTGGRLDFWSLENPIAGRSRGYQRVVIDEAAFAKDDDGEAPGALMETWERGIKPTLYDYGGKALVCSNSAGKNPDNFFYRICTEPQFGFHEYHATTLDNPLLPKRLAGEDEASGWRAGNSFTRRSSWITLRWSMPRSTSRNLWTGPAWPSSAETSCSSMVEPVPYPTRCDSVFAVIDTASKTGTDNDATAVTYFAYDSISRAAPLLILDWEVIQIEGAMLETWLPSVFVPLEDLCAGLLRALRFHRRVYRRQEFRHDLAAAGPAAGPAGPWPLIEAHRHG